MYPVYKVSYSFSLCITIFLYSIDDSVLGTNSFTRLLAHRRSRKRVLGSCISSSVHVPVSLIRVHWDASYTVLIRSWELTASGSLHILVPTSAILFTCILSIAIQLTRVMYLIKVRSKFKRTCNDLQLKIIWKNEDICIVSHVWLPLIFTHYLRNRW